MEKKTMESIKIYELCFWVKLLLVMLIPFGEWLYPKFGFTFFESWALGAITYIAMRGAIDDLFIMLDLRTVKSTIKDLYESIGVEEEES